MVPFGDAINAYQELGFEITGIFPLSREFDQLRVIEFDFVFMRPSNPCVPSARG